MRSHIHTPLHYQSNVLFFFAKVLNVLFNCSIMCQLQVKNPLAVSLNFLVLPKQQIISVTSNGRCPEVQRGN
jgi:hypothetical protein